MSTYLKFKTPLLLQCGTRLMALRRPCRLSNPSEQCALGPSSTIILKVQKAPWLNLILGSTKHMPRFSRHSVEHEITWCLGDGEECRGACDDWFHINWYGGRGGLWGNSLRLPNQISTFFHLRFAWGLIPGVPTKSETGAEPTDIILRYVVTGLSFENLWHLQRLKYASVLIFQTGCP